jgi:hypothetical protein
MKQCLGHQTWIPLRFIQATTERDAPLTDDELERASGAILARRARLTGVISKAGEQDDNSIRFAIDLAPMTHLDDIHEPLRIIDAIQDTIVALSHSITLLGREPLTTRWSRLLA